MNHRDHRNTKIYIVGYLVEEYHLLRFPWWPVSLITFLGKVLLSIA